MADHDLETLLGGFAADTLTPEERTRLYSTALRDQQLFNTLADEQALKELLADPAVRRRLLQALKQPGPSAAGRALPWWAWFRKPAGLALAGGLAAAVFAIAFGTRMYQESLDRAAQSVVTEEARPAAPSVHPAQPSKQTPPSRATPEPTTKEKAEPAKKEIRPDGKPAKRERLAPVTPQDQPASTSLADNAAPQREGDEPSKQAPVSTLGKATKRAAASTDRKLAGTAPPPIAVPAPATAPAPMQAPTSLSAASAPARKRSART